MEVSFGSIFTRRSALERSSGSTCESKEKSSMTTQEPTLSHWRDEALDLGAALRAQRLGDLEAERLARRCRGC